MGIVKRQNDTEGEQIAHEDIGGEVFQKILACDIGGVVLGSLANPVQVEGTVAVSNFPATQPVSGTVNVGNLPGTQPVSGPVTDAELRASSLGVHLTEIFEALKMLLRIISRPIWLDNAVNALRATITSGTVTTVTTVTTVSNVSGNLAMPFTLDRTSWSLNVRARIS